MDRLPRRCLAALARLPAAALFALAVLGPASAFESAAAYRAVIDNGIAIPGVGRGEVAQRYLRQSVRYPSRYARGTIVVDPAQHYLYWIESGTRALRYGVSVGKGAFAWSGQAVVARKATWPRWTPPAEMIDRSPNLRTYGRGLEGGLFNPLGARALYLYEGGRDTLYRIHGTSEWWSIGDDASSGCIRLLNQDVIDLASRVSVGTPVVVLAAKPPFVRRR